MRRTSLALAGGWLLAAALAAPAPAQSITNYSGTHVAPVRVSPYLRVPVGSRAEAAQLKAEQDAALAAQTNAAQKVKKKGKGG